MAEDTQVPSYISEMLSWNDAGHVMLRDIERRIKARKL
jgi:hypothetical protein